MSEKLSLDEIRQYWTKQAVEHGESPSASWSDHRVMEMEVREIVKRLEGDDRVLDVGCANGFSTCQFASQKKISVRGLDYVPEMIENARHRLKDVKGRLLGDVEFDVGNITALKEPSAAYDKVVVIRVVINLGHWDLQLKAIRECSRVLKKGGMLLLSEATNQGWRKLNDFRREWGLPDIPMPSFNLYLDETRIVEGVSDTLELVEINNFASTYFVGTRVLKALIARALGGDINVADPDMEWNRWFSQLPSFGDYGTQKLFVFRKR
jgi:SAM-dependent methyltransferase